MTSGIKTAAQMPGEGFDPVPTFGDLENEIVPVGPSGVWSLGAAAIVRGSGRIDLEWMGSSDIATLIRDFDPPLEPAGRYLGANLSGPEGVIVEAVLEGLDGVSLLDDVEWRFDSVVLPGSGSTMLLDAGRVGRLRRMTLNLSGVSGPLLAEDLDEFSASLTGLAFGDEVADRSPCLIDPARNLLLEGFEALDGWGLSTNWGPSPAGAGISLEPTAKEGLSCLRASGTAASGDVLAVARNYGGATPLDISNRKILSIEVSGPDPALAVGPSGLLRFRVEDPVGRSREWEFPAPPIGFRRVDIPFFDLWEDANVTAIKELAVGLEGFEGFVEMRLDALRATDVKDQPDCTAQFIGSSPAASPAVLVEDFESISGWTAISGSILLDSMRKTEGSSSLEVTSSGSGIFGAEKVANFGIRTRNTLTAQLAAWSGTFEAALELEDSGGNYARTAWEDVPAGAFGEVAWDVELVAGHVELADVSKLRVLLQPIVPGAPNDVGIDELRASREKRRTAGWWYHRP